MVKKNEHFQNEYYPNRDCEHAHKIVAQDALKNNYNKILVFEDDARLSKKITPELLGKMLSWIKNNNWDDNDEISAASAHSDYPLIIYKNGTIEKKITLRDLNLLKEGYNKSVELLKAIGVEPSSISSTPIRGAHPGGTAAIGRVVDKNLQTSVKGLFISDASVIPQAPGRPPILTIIALSKRLSKTIAQELTEPIIY